MCKQEMETKTRSLGFISMAAISLSLVLSVSMASTTADAAYRLAPCNASVAECGAADGEYELYSETHRRLLQVQQQQQNFLTYHAINAGGGQVCQKTPQGMPYGAGCFADSKHKYSRGCSPTYGCRS